MLLMRAHNELPLRARIGLRHDLRLQRMNCLRHEKPGNSIHENAVFKSLLSGTTIQSNAKALMTNDVSLS